MILYLQGHDFHFETENICRLFLPQEKIETVYAPPTAQSGIVAAVQMEETPQGAQLCCSLRLEDFDETRQAMVAAGTPDYTTVCERTAATLLYRLFEQLFSCSLDWGIVTGVRPVKLLRSQIAQHGVTEASRYFREDMLVSEEKLALCLRTWEAENRLLALSKPQSFSLYISIPFCPTRCDYCSFVSHTTERSAKLIPDYVVLLQQELRETARVAKEFGLTLESVYMGGGTPTSLSADQLAAILETVSQEFDLSGCREYTVEAGRPDTVTPDKLRAIRQAGVERVSINPQTLHDSVLEAIGRRHTTQQFYTAYNWARQVGFPQINTDLIAGLPTDTPDGFAQTIEGILALRPENVTVHTLSLKRASNLVVRHRSDYASGQQTSAMTSTASARLTDAGYHPYYLYRQARMVGNQENVGWALPGCDSVYNVWIMDESQTILGCGAGAVTKLKQPDGPHIERIFNFKFPYEYNDRHTEMLARKAGILDFYRRYPLPGQR